MPGRDSARAKLIHGGQSPLAHIERMKSLPRKKKRCAGGKGERGEGEGGKKQVAAHKNVCRFQEVQSDDPQSPDSLCNTFTEAGEEGNPPTHPPPFHSPDDTPLSPYSLGVRSEHGGCRLPPPLAQPPLVTCKVCCFSPRCRQWLLGMPGLPLASRGAWEDRPASPTHHLPASASEKTAQTHARCNKNQIKELFQKRE